MNQRIHNIWKKGENGISPILETEHEIEADLGTLRSSHTRGLLSFFIKEIEACEKNPNPLCEEVIAGGRGHPSHKNRVRYLTEALCENNPEENQDLCFHAKNLLSNETCRLIY